ncbi:MAG: ABC transporter ATP-binding protein [Bryobacterales bacterium]|nr:energy-coupling factor ABC transporter ATP-binding protein [Bryobacteraceae bacterium]MDW8355477.1 ABC transporter ATP-binding protein [Bryobacterales bacterium]
MEPLIEVQGLHFRYDSGPEVLRGVNFRLFPGESVALLGPNGSGKTTFVLHLNGLLRGEGLVRVCGLPTRPEHLPSIRRKVGILFQDPDEQLFMPTVLEDAAFGPLNLGLDPPRALHAAQEALALTGMSAAWHKAPYHLSAGEKRRAALAGVLAMRPEILVLDEPTTYLDPPGRRELADLLRRLPQAKLVVTHDATFACATTTRAVFFREGRIESEGPTAELIRRLGWDERLPPAEPAP